MDWHLFILFLFSFLLVRHLLSQALPSNWRKKKELEEIFTLLTLGQKLENPMGHKACISILAGSMNTSLSISAIWHTFFFNSMGLIFCGFCLQLTIKLVWICMNVFILLFIIDVVITLPFGHFWVLTVAYALSQSIS